MDENQECVICHQFNDQMLMLQCIHDPCINCAAIHYAEEFKGKLKNYYYTCQLCGERTALDISSVIELEKLAPKRIEQPVSIKKPAYRDIGAESSVSINRKDRYDIGIRDSLREPRSDSYKDNYNHPVRQTPEPYRNNISEQSSYTNERTLKNLSSRTCKEHADEEVSYYCFKCYENICPECAIHGNWSDNIGSHQGHDVKATKKAIIDVKKQFGTIIDSISKNQDSLRKNKDHYLRKIKQLQEETLKQKAFVSKEFEILRSQLMTKQREYLRELDDIGHRNTSILNTQIQLINKQTEQSTKLIRNIEQTLKRDQVTVLDEFGRKNQSYSNQIQKMSVSQVGYSNVPGLKQANLSDLKQITSTINGAISQQGIRAEDLVYNG